MQPIDPIKPHTSEVKPRTTPRKGSRLVVQRGGKRILDRRIPEDNQDTGIIVLVANDQGDGGILVEAMTLGSWDGPRVAAALASMIGHCFPQLPERMVRNAVKVTFDVAQAFDKELFALMQRAVLEEEPPKPTAKRSWGGYL